MRTVKLAKEMYLGSIWIPIRNICTSFVEGGLAEVACLGLVDLEQ